MSQPGRVLIVGASGSSHVGGSLLRAAHTLGIPVQLCDSKQAWDFDTIAQKILWRIADRRPRYLRKFERTLSEKIGSFEPDIIIATGLAPMSAGFLRAVRAAGIRLVNFSTDDPFNPQHRARWFLEALREYDAVLTPRRSNESELISQGCRRVEYLPFGYDPDLFFPVKARSEDISDLFFAGVGDSDRLPYIEKALRAGLNVRLHGIAWERFSATRRVTRGQADLRTLRQAIAGCRVALCLVRKSNRDGHSMRTFELPAVGACTVVEDTEEHRVIFGDEGEQVLYFRNPEEMASKVKILLADELLRGRLRDLAHRAITQMPNTYADRLNSMLSV